MKNLKDILLIVSVCIIVWQAFRKPVSVVSEIIRTDTVIVIRTDTFRITEPVYITKRVVDTFRIVLRQSDTVYLPVEQLKYEDSLYTAWVSGYRARLDSIRIYRPSEIRYITRDVLQKAKPRRWGIALQAGYGLSKEGLSPYVGLGLSYNLIMW